ncbi:cytochrome P450 [Crucibulum laeve]|uniref:Cytochrome P450 n=1 Tax=Crucibulum laeve TaxID=68775 RepID=A0A5C3M9U9_9AGAR|nr:cytochrome P450 [Crucibulum laeve]
MSILYRAYYDVVKNGGLLNQIKILHEIYGPVIRIGPNELHFSDPSAYHKNYAPGSSFVKDPFLYRCFMQSQESSFTFMDPQESRVRREMLNPLFSRRAILKLENVIQEKIDKLVNRITSYPGKVVNISLAFRCATVDIISSYCFAESIEALDEEEFQSSFVKSTIELPKFAWLVKYLPFIGQLFLSMPVWLAQRYDPFYDTFRALRMHVSKQVDHYLENEAALENAEHEVVYHHLIKPKNQRDYSTPSREALNSEVLVLLQAGSETVGAACTVGTFYATKNAAIRKKLVSELRNAWPDINASMPYTSLEKLPYLTAVIKESLRITCGVVTPLPRIVGPGDAEISGYAIPAGTVVSIGATFIHSNSAIFRDPDSFYPERWLEEDTSEMERYFVPFSRGPRMCLGINLAWCELYLLFGNIFRKLEVDLTNTNIQDFKEFTEHFSPAYETFYAQVERVIL